MAQQPRKSKVEDSKFLNSEPGFELVEVIPIAHFESSKITVKGSHRVDSPGTYVLYFDNTFSVNTSKKLFFFIALKEPDPEGPHVREYQGWILKKGEKRSQGYSKRWLKIDVNGSLQYFKNPKGGSRGSVSLYDSAVRLKIDKLLIDIDSGQNIYHFQALNEKDFQTLVSVIETHVETEEIIKESKNSLEISSELPSDDGSLDENHKETKQIIETLCSHTNRLGELSDSLKIKTNLKNPVIKDIQSLALSISESSSSVLSSTNSLKANISQYYITSQLVLDHLKMTELILKEAINDNNRVRRQLGMEQVTTSHFIGKVSNRNSIVPPSTTGSTGNLSKSEIFYDAEDIDDEDDVFLSKEDDDEEDVFVSETELSIASETKTIFDSKESTGKEPLSYKAFPIARRKKLPASTISMENISIMSILRNNVGKDLSTVAMPIILNEPLNLLQKICEELEYSRLLDQAAATEDAVERLLLVTAFAVSAYASTSNRAGRKPFNPLLGETFEYVREDLGFKFISEKVSHHPPVMAVHGEGNDWIFFQDSYVKTKFWGKSMELIPSGTVHVIFKNRGEHYTWGKVTTCMRNVFNSSRYLEHYGPLTVKNQTTGTSCQLQFKESGLFSSSKNDVEGTVVDQRGSKLLSIKGKWNESLTKFFDSSPNSLEVFWRANSVHSNHKEMYGFSNFALELNELTPDISGVVPKTDTRLRPDQTMYEMGDAEGAELEKQRLENKQRESRKEREDLEEDWVPRWFELKPVRFEESVDNSASGKAGYSWQFNGNYFNTRAKGFGSDIPDIF